MKRKNLAKKLTAMLMTGAMVMSMGMTAFGANAEVKFTKTLDMTNATGASVPAVTFNFSINKGNKMEATENGLEINPGPVKEENGEVTAPKINPVSFPSADGKTTQNVTVDFTGVTFDEPGIYRYVITENNTTGTVSADISNDKNATRYLDVYVERKGSTCEITSFVLLKDLKQPVLKTNTDKGNEAVYEGIATTEKNVGYVNEYHTYDLTLTKKVDGTMGNKNTPFDFNIVFSNGPANASFTVDVEGGGTWNDSVKTIVLDANGAADLTGAVSLKDNQSITIKGIPSTVKYTIEEQDPKDGYTTDITITRTDETASSSTATRTTNLQDMGKRDHTVEYKNTKNAVSPTGIAMTFAPYIAMVAFAGVVAVMFLRKKKEDF